MAIAFVNSVAITAGYASGVSVSTPSGIAVTAGNLLIVGVRGDLNPLTSATVITDTAGNTFTFIGNSASVAMWYAKNVIGNASDIITATFPSSRSYVLISVAQFSGIDSSPLDATATGITPSGTTITSGSFTTTKPNELLACVINVETGNTWTAGSGYTLTANGYNGVIALQYKIVSSIQSSVTASATSTDSVSYKMIIVGTFSDIQFKPIRSVKLNQSIHRSNYY